MSHRLNRRTLLQASAAAALPMLPWAAAAQERRFEPKPGAWRTFEVTTTVSLAEVKGDSRVWLPVPSVDSSYQKPLESTWIGNAARARLVSDPARDVRMLYAEFPASVTAPTVTLTSRLQNIPPGDLVIVGNKPTGTLVIDYLLPGKRLYMMSSGTGLAPFMSIIRDPATYEKFSEVVLVHGVRQVAELAYHDYLTHELRQHELLGEMVSEQLRYYPTVTREPYVNTGRITDLIVSGKLFTDLGVPTLHPEGDRVMICGSPGLLKDLKMMLEMRGFNEGNTSKPGHFVVERAFVEQ